MRFTQLLSTLALLLLSTSQALAQLTPEQQAAKERGLMLYHQYKEAVPDLRVAAEAGDRERNILGGVPAPGKALHDGPSTRLIDLEHTQGQV